MGYAFNPVFSVEGQVAFLTNNLKDMKINGSSVVDEEKFDGHQNATLGMINGILSFGDGWTLKPYIGAGAGYAHCNTKVDTELTFPSGSGFVQSSMEVKETKGAFAFQGIVGLSYAISDYTKLNMDYRFLNVNEYKAKIQNSNNEVKINFSKHLIIVSITQIF